MAYSSPIRWLTHHLPALAWAILIAAVLFAPPAAVPSWPPLPPHFDKLIHALLFAVLAGLVARALALRRRRSARRVVALTFALCVGYGVATELAQRRFFDRSAELGDLAADAAGAALALTLRQRLSRRSARDRIKPS